ncbi:MAG: YdcH family protein [Asticcacaulis sp.]
MKPTNDDDTPVMLSSARVEALPVSSRVLALRHEAAVLRQEHQDLDASIQALEIMPVPDQILIARLKRKKLALRDQIVEIEDQILPDIIA